MQLQHDFEGKNYAPIALYLIMFDDGNAYHFLRWRSSNNSL